MSSEFESGAFYRHPAWHRDGNLFLENDRPRDAREAAERSGNRWDVESRPLFYMLDDGTYHMSSHHAVVREIDQTELGVCGSKRVNFQNLSAYETIWPLVDSGYFDIEASGSLRNGKIQWILLRQSKSQIIPLDYHTEYLLVLWSHDGTLNLSFRLTRVRVVCMNTVMAALRQRGEKLVKIRHVGDMMARLPNIEEVYLTCKDAFAQQAKELSRLAEIPASREWVNEGVNRVFGFGEEAKAGKPNSKGTAVTNFIAQYQKGISIPGVANTRYGFFTGITEFIEHINGSRIKDRGQNILLGKGAELSDKAWDYANAGLVGV